MNSAPSQTLPQVAVPFGAWHDETRLALTFPAGWKVHLAGPAGAAEITDAQIDAALAAPIDAPALAELARGRRSAAIAVDDLTRPTPAYRFLPRVLDALHRGGIARSNVRIIFGTAAHRPMDRAEIALKIGREIQVAYHTVMHDFLGDDLQYLGWVDGGPVYLNRSFLDADLRIVVGSVIPHGETGFGGGAKMIVPGLAGHRTIAHFHGALPPRRSATLEAEGSRRDRRAWSEAVARRIRVDWAICATVNASRQLAGLYCGDVVAAHRRAARHALQIGRTRVAPDLAAAADVAVVNAYPLDTDPIQMGKSVSLVRKLGVRSTVVINAASDGIFYHGMGMGSGVSARRLIANLPRLLLSPRGVWTFARSLGVALGSADLMARTCYFTLNPLAWSAFTAPAAAGAARGLPAANTEPLVYSRRFPAGGFARKYRRGALFDSWDELRNALARRHGSATALVFPCAPLQLIEMDEA